ncbi:hypothetical protein BD779DRAFT_1671075 [Infundibulicybe gibba]|nr:hypothetical protein BD779DRAFT_1671075 [Infundibulicybe gibba]
MQWIAVDDQSIDVVDGSGLLLYLGTELQDEDLPRRTKLSQTLMERFEAEYKKMVAELKV